MNYSVSIDPIDTVTPFGNNPRQITPDAIAKVAKSIELYGFRSPIVVDEDRIILAGHTRLLAAQKLGLSEVPVHVASGLSKSKKRAYRLADNRSAEESRWDFPMLTEELGELMGDGFDLADTLFDPSELANLFPDEPIEGLTDEDEVPEVQDDPVSVLGDVWVLGRHRLMCGDSTSIDAVEELMDGQRADMVFTDPPYNIDYQGVKDKREKIKNDKMSDHDFAEFLRQSLMACDTMYVCCSWQFAHLFKEAMTDLGCAPKAMIIWNKVNPAQNLDKYYKQHEIIFYFGEFGGQKTLRGDIWEIKRQKNTVHPTMKPVEIIDLAINDQPNKKIVYDAFGGSGSTLISCEKNHRDCRMMELDPKYCDVIIERWQNFTGKQAVLLSTDETFDALKEQRCKAA